MDALEDEVAALKAKNVELQRSLDNALSELTVAGCVKEDMIELERQRNGLNDEKASLESLLVEAQDELTSTRTHFEHECARLRSLHEQLENENKELKLKGGSLADQIGPAVDGSLVDKETLSAITDATKSLARRMKSNLMPQNKSLKNLDEESGNAIIANEDPTGINKASEDAEVLKAIVVPLEEQISALKDKLRQADSLLRQMEESQSETLFSAEVLGHWLAGKSTFAEAMEELERRGQEFKEAFPALLSARLGLVIKELGAVRSENDRNSTELEKSLKKCTDLRSQAAEANGRLLRNQQKHVAEMARLVGVLSEDQKLQVSQMSANSASDDQTVAGSEAIVVGKTDWESLHMELSKMRALMGVGLETNVVGSDQFQQLMGQLADSRAKLEKQASTEAKLRNDLQVIESQWNDRAEKHRAETTSLAIQVEESGKLLAGLQASYRSAFEEANVRLVKLSADRVKIVAELKRLQRENDEILGARSAKASELQSEVINLPAKTEDMHLLLLRQREQLISAKLAAEHHESRRKRAEADLSAEIQSLRSNVQLLDSCRTELEAVQKRSAGLESVVRTQRQERAVLDKELEAGATQRARLENSAAELRSRIANLQQELDNSVAVQTDFVRLSQSLQVELEKIRQSETEVRWQHEDDVDDCSSCHLSFGMGKRKHHCRHCGRIFCADCLSKTVGSGPHSRPSKVCEVCHTLLVQNSAPYFSTVAPSLR